MSENQFPMTETTYPYIWNWRSKPAWNNGTPPRLFDRDRRGERLRVICRGAMNSALVEFEDGYRTVTSRNGLRRMTQPPNREERIDE